MSTKKKSEVTSAGKLFLSHHIQHAKTHNRVLEESEMWRQREEELISSAARKAEVKYDSSFKDRSDGRHALDDSERRTPTPERCRSGRRAHMDSTDRASQRLGPWNQALYEFEEKSEDRWGHSGYRELYPHMFASDSSSSETVEDSRPSKRKISRKLSTEGPEKKKKSSKKKRKRKRRTEDINSDSRSSSSLSSSSDTDREGTKRKKARGGRKKSKKHSNHKRKKRKN